MFSRLALTNLRARGRALARVPHRRCATDPGFEKLKTDLMVTELESVRGRCNALTWALLLTSGALLFTTYMNGRTDDMNGRTHDLMFKALEAHGEALVNHGEALVNHKEALVNHKAAIEKLMDDAPASKK
jgi:hypothetical protein